MQGMAATLLVLEDDEAYITDDFTATGVLQRAIGCEQVDILERRRLVGDLVGFEVSLRLFVDHGDLSRFPAEGGSPSVPQGFRLIG